MKISGTLRTIAATGWRKQRLLVLCYHGVSLRDEHQWNPNLFLSPERFESRMRSLATLRYNVLPLDEALSRLEAGSLPPRAVAITFDDGFADFSLQAWPILQKYGFPATLYLTTHYVFHRCAVFNLVIPYILWRCSNRKAAPNQDFGWNFGRQSDGQEICGLSSPESRQRLWEPLIQLSLDQRLTTEGKEELAARVAEHLGFDYAEFRKQRLLELMTPEEVARLAREGLDIQLHTHRHRTPARMDLFEKELRDNRICIEELTGRTPHHFCYPSGVSKAGMSAVLRSLGVISATTCVAGLAEAATDPLNIPRFLDADHLDDATFESWLSGVAAFLPKRAGNGMGSEFPYIE